MTIRFNDLFSHIDDRLQKNWEFYFNIQYTNVMLLNNVTKWLIAMPIGI